MPTISRSNLAFAYQDDRVTLDVTYSVTFSALERYLAQHGLVFQERITIIGEDPGTMADVVLHVLPTEPIEIPSGTTELEVSHRRTVVVSRASLREDSIVSNDEISCLIELQAVGLPRELTTSKTPEVTLARVFR
jgi:hypothetical protein